MINWKSINRMKVILDTMDFFYFFGFSVTVERCDDIIRMKNWKAFEN